MEQHDIFLSYSHKDYHIATALHQKIEEQGCSVFIDTGLTAGADWTHVIADAIVQSNNFLVLITENTLKSHSVRAELTFAIERSVNYAKNIFPVLVGGLKNEHLPIGMQFMLQPYQVFRLENDTPAQIEKLARQIGSILRKSSKKGMLYEKLSEYRKIGADRQTAGVLCDLIPLIAEELEDASSKNRQNLYTELFRCVEMLEQTYTMEFDSENKALARRKMEALSIANKAFEAPVFEENDLYYISMKIRLLYLDREIRRDCVDIITGGDLYQGIISTLPEDDYAKKQEAYVAKYQAELERQGISQDNNRGYSSEKLDLILSTPEYIYQGAKQQSAKAQTPVTATKEDELLQAVASFMHEGNRVFDLIGQEQQAEAFLRCLLTSYERLKSYCEIVGAMEICAACVERIAELKQKLTTTGQKSDEEGKAETGIKTLLGLTLPKCGKYDVFISYKHEDAGLAGDMYRFLKRNMKEAFYDKVTLPELSASDYQDAIMEAIENSKHFVVMISNLKYLDSDWIRLEMKTFNSEIQEGRKPDSNFVIVATNEVYDQIISSNKRCIDIRYRWCEIMRVSEYQERLLDYLR